MVSIMKLSTLIGSMVSMVALANSTKVESTFSAKAFENQIQKLTEESQNAGILRLANYYKEVGVPLVHYSEMPSEKRLAKAKSIFRRWNRKAQVNRADLNILADAYFDGQQYDLAYQIYEQLAKDGDLFGLTKVGWTKLNQGQNPQEKARGLEMLRQAAAWSGNGFAASLIGQAYLYGVGVSRSEDQAFHWLGKAAFNDPDASQWMAEFAEKVGRDSQMKQNQRFLLELATKALQPKALHAMADFAWRRDFSLADAADWEYLAWAYTKDEDLNRGNFPRLASLLRKSGYRTDSERRVEHLKRNATKMSRERLSQYAGFGLGSSYYYGAHYVEWMGGLFIGFGFYLLVVHPLVLRLFARIRGLNR